MIPVKIEVDISQADKKLKEKEKELPNRLETLNDDSTNIVRNETVEEAPIGETGDLAGSTAVEFINPYESLVYSDVEHAIYVIKGTPAHIIRAKRKKALHIPMSGTYLGVTKSGYGLFKSVHHPGTKPNPYNKRAAEQSIPKIESGPVNQFINWVES